MTGTHPVAMAPLVEKIYHPTNKPNLITSYRQKCEEYLIGQLGTAATYGPMTTLMAWGT